MKTDWPRKCEYLTMSKYFQKLGGWWRILEHLIEGVRSRIPFCCVCEFTFREAILHQAPATTTGCLDCKTCPAFYVHCFFHRWLRH